LAPRSAERRLDHDRCRRLRRRLGNSWRVGAQLPWLRRAGPALKLGQYAQRVAGDVPERALAGVPARPDDSADGAVGFPDRRWPPRRTRSPAAIVTRRE